MSLAQAEFSSPANESEWRLRLQESGALLRLAFPIMLIALVNMGMSVTDTVMVSILFGADALAAVAVGSDLYSIVFYICAGVIGGLSPFYTAAVTRADAAERARLLRIGWMIIALLAAATVPLVWTAPLWLAHLGLDPVLLAHGEGFTQTMALTLIPMLGVTLYRVILTAAEKPKVFLKVTLAMLPLNAAGNFVLMLGLGPIPALGPVGAGLSTLLVALASFTVLMIVARRTSPAAASAAVWDWHGLLAVLRVGLPIGISMLAETGIFLGATLYAATLGSADVAAHTLTLRMSGVAYAGSAALLQASMVRMARAEALGDARTGRAVITGSLILSFGGGVLLFLILAGSAAPLASAFFAPGPAGAAAAQIAVGLLILLAVMELAAYPALAASGLLRGCRDTRAPMLYTVAAYWMIGAPLGIYLCEVKGMGVTGLWTGLITGSFAYAGLLFLRLAGRRIRP